MVPFRLLLMKENIMQRGISKDQIQRVARIYKHNQDASKAIGITLRSFSRLCRKYGVETPYARRLKGLRRVALA
jgi:uncharacterized protein YjhX (UPF0386 family)